MIRISYIDYLTTIRRVDCLSWDKPYFSLYNRNCCYQTDTLFILPYANLGCETEQFVEVRNTCDWKSSHTSDSA